MYSIYIAGVSPLDVLAQSAETQMLQQEVTSQATKIKMLVEEVELARREVAEKESVITELEAKLALCDKFSVATVQKREQQLKGLFQFYTGIAYIRFCTLLTFLVPDGQILPNACSRRDAKNLSLTDGLFLTLCRLRQNFALKDLSMRFGLSLQSSGEIFNAWIDHMYYKLSQVPIWPKRQTIINQMPSEYKRDFPTSIIIIDGTEIKTQAPSALSVQSQFYSDYKSSTTLKSLVGCTPDGSICFISELYTGSISDKELTERSGFYSLLQGKLDTGRLHVGDAIMADKGFTIRSELAAMGLQLNIPPFASEGAQMSAQDVQLTEKVARHRIHIERLIRKIKCFKMISNTVPCYLFKKINDIWSVCALLTLFQDVFVKDTAHEGLQ